MHNIYLGNIPWFYPRWLTPWTIYIFIRFRYFPLCKYIGPLTSVLNLETDGGRSSINVSWGAPFTLDVTDEDPDIWYSVLIYNVTDEENPTTVPCTDCHNLTQIHYVFIPDFSSPCHKYTFAVIPHNGVGEGETSKNVTGYSINSELEFLCIYYLKVEQAHLVIQLAQDFYVSDNTFCYVVYKTRGLPTCYTQM